MGNAAAFLSSPLASAITGAVVYVDNGLNAMGVGVDSPVFKDLNIPKDKHWIDTWIAGLVAHELVYSK